MKTPAIASIRNIARILSEKAMFTAMAMLCIRFFKAYMAVVVWYAEIANLYIPNVAHAPKRIINPNIHDRKFALFPCSAGHGCFT